MYICSRERRVRNIKSPDSNAPLLLLLLPAMSRPVQPAEYGFVYDKGTALYHHDRWNLVAMVLFNPNCCVINVVYGSNRDFKDTFVLRSSNKSATTVIDKLGKNAPFWIGFEEDGTPYVRVERFLFPNVKHNDGKNYSYDEVFSFISDTRDAQMALNRLMAKDEGGRISTRELKSRFMTTLNPRFTQLDARRTRRQTARPTAARPTERPQTAAAVARPQTAAALPAMRPRRNTVLPA